MRSAENVDYSVVGKAEQPGAVAIGGIRGVEVETERAGNVRLERGESGYTCRLLEMRIAGLRIGTQNTPLGFG